MIVVRWGSGWLARCTDRSERPQDYDPGRGRALYDGPDEAGRHGLLLGRIRTWRTTPDEAGRDLRPCQGGSERDRHPGEACARYILDRASVPSERRWLEACLWAAPTAPSSPGVPRADEAWAATAWELDNVEV